VSEVRRLLLTGAGGLLGSNIAALAGGDYLLTKIFSNRAKCESAISLDLSKPENRKGIVAYFKPDVVINCAANPSVESCENRELSTYQINVELPEDLAMQAAAYGAKFIQVSSDAVYSGNSGNYSELSTASPANAYGEMKLEAEFKVLAANPESLILRTNFFGLSAESDRGLADFFISNLMKGRSVKGFNDSFISSIYVDSLVKSIFQLVDANAMGVLNLGSNEKVSKYVFGRMIAQAFELDERLVIPAKADEIQSIPRGRDLSLDISRATSILGTSLPTVYEGIANMKHDLESGRRLALQRQVRQ
jgi:dTDP-4-dehydrorhamnose reductase